MLPFLRQVAQHILRQEGDDLRSVAVVLPSIRAKKSLIESFAQEKGAALWAPRILTMDALAYELSGLSMADSLEMQCLLYDIHTNLEEAPLSPEEFFPLASKMLSDFSDIDAYGIDPNQIFAHLHSVKSVEQWNPDGGQPTQWQTQYLRFYERLLDYYQALNSVLDERKQAYFGKALRRMTQRLNEQESVWNYNKTYFVGLNALTESEQLAIQYLYDRHQAELLWDADEYYLLNPQHPAGFFLRKWRKNFERSFNFVDKSYAKEKQIRVFALANDIGQAHSVAQSLIQWLPEKPQDQIAVVLGSENLLLPILNALPEPILKKINVTMGLSIVYTQVYAMLDALFKLHARAESLADADPIKGRRYPHNEVMALMCNPLCKTNTFSPKAYYLETDIKSWLPKTESIDGLFELIKEVLERVKDHLHTDLERAAEAKIIKTLEQVHTWLSNYHLPLTYRLFYKLFHQIFSPIRIAIQGDPKAPIQIMGLLETRAMDFESVIVCSLNEGILPEATQTVSLIPSDVKYYYGLPLKREKDALLAYHFYRLLQRPTNIELLYTTQVDPLSGSEKSRYIHQIELDLLRYNPTIVFSEQARAPKIDTPSHSSPLPIKKDDPVIKALWDFAQHRGLSATSLTTFVNCSLKFYYKEIKRLQLVETPSDDPDAMIMGNAIHKVLESLYRPLSGVLMGQDRYKQMLQTDIDAMLLAEFKAQLSTTDFSSGKPYLMRFVAEKMLRRFLQKEADWVQSNELTIDAVEYKLDTHIEIQGKPVKCKGIIDRVDRSAYCTRILDYKTGALNPKELRVSLEDLFVTSDKAREYDKSMQLLFYTWLLWRQEDRSDNSFQAGIVSTRQTNAYVQTLNVDDQDVLDPSLMKIVEGRVRDLLERLFDAKSDFVPCADLDYCILCDYRMLCGR